MELIKINSILKSASFVLYLCFFVVCTQGTLDKNNEIYLKQTSLVSALEDAVFLSDSPYSSSNFSCNCGENSVSCNLKDGMKICECKPGYAPGEYENCAPTCNSTNKCNNGGSCVKGICICLPGTRGPYCDIIEGCSELNCGKDKNSTCSYDKKNFKAFCSCKEWHHEFDYDDNKCKECSCDDCQIGQRCYSNAIKCEIIQGKKMCTCRRSYKFNPKAGICDFCMTSKEVESCDFNPEGERVRRCKERYGINYGDCTKCNCGLWESCKFINNKKVCLCDKGYTDDRGTCRSCDCGNGKCEFDWNYRKTKCICDPGYFEESGKCMEIKNCYCGENATCKFENNVKLCDCASGYQDINGICADINECDNPKACDSSMICINNDGSYECVCKNGFQESSEPGKCEDINECLKETSCPDENTDCLNTVGSYKCYCKTGYATRVDENSPVLCESKSGWKVGYGLLIGIFLAVIVILLVGIRKYQ